jgi:hypothetical protein
VLCRVEAVVHHQADDLQDVAPRCGTPSSFGMRGQRDRTLRSEVQCRRFVARPWHQHRQGNSCARHSAHLHRLLNEPQCAAC